MLAVVMMGRERLLTEIGERCEGMSTHRRAGLKFAFEAWEKSITSQFGRDSSLAFDSIHQIAFAAS